jgi:hypothetical protein
VAQVNQNALKFDASYLDLVQGPGNFNGKGPQLLLWDGWQVAYGKVTQWFI